MRKKAIKLSVDDQEINYYIRCRNPSDNTDQPVDLVACSLLDVPFPHDCIASLHVHYSTFPFLMTVLQSFVRHPFHQYNALY